MNNPAQVQPRTDSEVYQLVRELTAIHLASNWNTYMQLIEHQGATTPQHAFEAAFSTALVIGIRETIRRIHAGPPPRPSVN